MLLLLSLALHLLLLRLISQHGLPGGSQRQAPATVALQLQLRMPQSPPVADAVARSALTAEDGPIPEKPAVLPEDVPGKQAQISALHEPAGADSQPRRVLDLSLPDSFEPEPNPVISSSATVFNPELARQINLQRRRFASGSGTQTSTATQAGSTMSFQAGRWQSFVRIGNLCFEVIEANPLEPLSTEQWYAVDCD
jgi:hypothetical protein